MSEYCTTKTQFKDRDALVEALVLSTRWTREQIIVSDEPQHLYGYHNDKRPQTAHIVVPGSGHPSGVNAVGASSNDIGYEKQADGSYVAHISQFDRHQYGEAWQKTVKQNYALRKMTRQAEAAGRRVMVERVGGKLVGQIVGYR